MGHRVPNHKSKCSNPHGHRYKIEVGVNDKVVTTKGASDEGMVIDYGDLKQIMMEVIDAKLDHGFMVYEHDSKVVNHFISMRDVFNMKVIVVPFIPTAENIAKWLYELMKIRLDANQIAIKFVRVWETPTSTAMYYDADYDNDSPSREALFG